MEGQHVNRLYRRLHEGHDLVYFSIKLKESDLAIGVDKTSYSDSLVSMCRQELIRIRAELESYISLQPSFQHSLEPIQLLPSASPLVHLMADAARQAGVGPMAAVAGTVAQAVGQRLDPVVKSVIVENGGDIYLNGNQERVAAVYAGQSKFSHRIGIKISVQEQPLGICTSSGTVGPSLSFGSADAVVIKGYPAALADAVATRIGNMIHCEEDLKKAVETAQDIPGVTGVLAIKNETMAAWGAMELVPI
jgi:ApbE superfamily uncharacterized protein (UPF0280 family)